MKILLVVGKVVRIRTKLARCVSSLVMIEVATAAHALLGATSDRFISTVGREGPSNGTHYFLLTYIVRLTVD